MTSFWKIFLLVCGVIIIAVVAAAIWFYVAFFNIDTLDLSATTTDEEKVEEVDRWFKQLQSSNQFNGAVLLIKNDKVIFKQAYGYVDCSKTKRLTTKSMFRLASVSKQFTAAGIMLMHDNKKLNFDDPVKKHIPNFPYPDVTIRHLLNNTSGIPDVYMYYTDKFPKMVGDVLTIQKMLNIFLKHPPENVKKPNEVYEYSNTNYVLLAALIEKISGLSYENYMKTYLFKPLDMKNTRIWNLVSDDKTFMNKAQDFDNYNDECQDLIPGILDGVAGDGAVFSTVEDFVIWNQFWYSNQLISASTMKEAFKEPILNDGSTSEYGFGWMLSTNETLHYGQWLGANTMILRNIKKKNCLVLLDNSSNSDVLQKMEFQLSKVFD